MGFSGWIEFVWGDGGKVFGLMEYSIFKKSCDRIGRYTNKYRYK